MPLLDALERERLEDADRSLLRFQTTMEEAAQSGALGPEQLQRFITTLREAAKRVNVQLLPQIDPASANEISRRLIDVLTMDATDRPVLDAADAYLMELEAIRHVLRDLLDEQQPEGLRREGAALIALLEEWLPGVSVSELAELLGHSVRQLQRRRHETGTATSREQLVARLVAILRHAWTDAGVVAWFRRPRRDLGGAAPLELLGEPAQERALLVAARTGRVQGGS